ncbi:MAG: hypothetical protein GOU97_03930 [Nanoarchaeota archaeon]|nr:hypothetical protein [Nanoarchaeota archaeon]
MKFLRRVRNLGRRKVLEEEVGRDGFRSAMQVLDDYLVRVDLKEDAWAQVLPSKHELPAGRALSLLEKIFENLVEERKGFWLDVDRSVFRRRGVEVVYFDLVEGQFREQPVKGWFATDRYEPSTKATIKYVLKV